MCDDSAGSAESVGRPVVLVVEDDSQLLRLQVNILRHLDVDVVTAMDARSARDILERREVAGIVSDMRMPGEMTGVDLFFWVRDNRPHIVPHFLFVTGGEHHPRVAEWLADHPDHCLTKPYRLPEYLERVRRLLEVPVV